MSARGSNARGGNARGDRYSRQTRVAGFGSVGQERLGAASVMIVGIGALGTHSAEALCRAGIGRLRLVDRDIVELSNLQRQTLFDEADAEAGTPKAIAAASHLQRLNSECEVTPEVKHCSASFLDELEQPIDLVLDGTDNFETRYLLNDWCSKQGIPWIYAAAVGTEGIAMVVRPGGACLRCLWPQPPASTDVANCETAGILSPAIAAVTAFQVAEALKLLSGNGAAVAEGVFTCDVWRGSYQLQVMASAPSLDCEVCRGDDFPALRAEPTSAVTLCGRDAVQVDPPRQTPLDLDALAERLAPVVEDLSRTQHLLRFTADGCRFSIFPGGRGLLFGVNDPLRARALYDRWVGTS